MNSTWNKDKLHERGEEGIIIHIFKKGDKTDCSTYRGMSLLSSTFKNVIQHPAVKANYMCGGNYLLSSV
jgi:hypothetical protein